MCFLHLRFSRLLCSFSLENFSYQGPGYVLGLCAMFIADTNQREPCVSRSLEEGIIFLVFSYFQAKYQKYLSCGAISHSDAIFF